MGTKLGIVGLPNSGKSTLFNALTSAKAQVAPYPFTTTDRNVGVAQLEDTRLIELAKAIPHDKLIPTSIEFVDIAGLIKGAHKGEGLGNQFLSHVFAVDALIHVVRCFDEPDIPHTMGSVEPERDVEVIKMELMLKDLEILERRIEKEDKLARSGDKHAQAIADRLNRLKQALNAGNPIRKLNLSSDEHPHSLGIDLLSAKPLIYIANIDENSLQNENRYIKKLAEIARQDEAELISLCAKLEAEISELEPNEQETMRKEMGLLESVLPQVVRSGYKALGLITFFTTASNMLQAWTIPNGVKAPKAAGVIHTDFEKHFIRAEVIGHQELISCQGEAQARSKGLLRLEGKDYIVKDGDVIHFRIGS